MLQFAFGRRHDFLEAPLGNALFFRRKNESHPAAGHASQHPEAPKILGELRAHASDECFRIKGAGPRDDALNRLSKIARGGQSDGADVAALQRRENFLQCLQRFLAGAPLRLGPEQVFFGDHFEDGADVLGHAAVNEHEARLQIAAGFGRNIAVAEDAVLRHESAPADAPLRIAVASEHSGNQFHSRPDAARVLPAAAGTAEPFSEDRARENQSPFVFLQRAGERGGLACGAHADADEGREQAGGDGQTRTFRDIVHAADQFEAAPVADDAREQFGQTLA